MANQGEERQVVAPVSILVASRTSATVSPQNTEFTRVEENGVHYEVEPASERLQPNQGLQSFGSPSITGETEYQRLFNTTLPPSHRRPYAGSSHSNPLVEVPDNVLSSPALIAPRPPQFSRPSELGPLNSNRHRSSVYINNSQPGLSDEEAPSEGNARRNRQGHHRPPSPPASINITQLPNMHLYCF